MSDKVCKILILLFSVLLYLKFLLIDDLVQNNFEKSHHFYPFISYLINDFFVTNLPQKIFLFIKTVIIPSLILYILYIIFSKYLKSNLALFISILSISVYEKYPFRDFIFDITNLEFTDNNNLLLYDFPIPGFSSLIFLILYLLIFNIKKLNNIQVYLYPILISSYFYINGLDSIFLVSFWIIFICFKIYKSQEYNYFNILYQLFIIVLIIGPGIINGEIIVNEYDSYSQSNYIIVTYYILPIVGIGILYFINRIDPYEIFVKFKHIYLFYFIELSIVTLSSKSFPININDLNSQIPQFFIHLSYYIPIIYYLSRPTYKYSRGIESNLIITNLRYYIFNLFNKVSDYLIIILILLLFLYNFIFFIL